MCKKASQNYAKTGIRMDKTWDCIFARRLREPLRKPSVSGVLSDSIFAKLQDLLDFYTKRYILCFKTIAQIDTRPQSGTTPLKSVKHHIHSIDKHSRLSTKHCCVIFTNNSYTHCCFHETLQNPIDYWYFGMP